MTARVCNEPLRRERRREGITEIRGDVMDALDKPFVLFGHSLGAAVVELVAAARSARALASTVAARFDPAMTTVTAIEKSGHWTHIERPSAVAAEINRFLAELPAGAAGAVPPARRLASST